MAQRLAHPRVRRRVARRAERRRGLPARLLHGRITDYADKPDEPAGDLVTNEVVVFESDTLLDLLEQLGEEADDDGLDDLGDAVLLHGAVVEAGAVIERAIVDAGARISGGARVGGPRPDGADDLAVVLVAEDEVVPGDAHLPAGARFPDED